MTDIGSPNKVQVVGILMICAGATTAALTPSTLIIWYCAGFAWIGMAMVYLGGKLTPRN